MKIELPDLEATQRFGAAIADKLRAEGVVTEADVHAMQDEVAATLRAATSRRP